MNAEAWYATSTGNHQGLVIAEGTGENIAVTYDKKHAALVAAAPEIYKSLLALEKRLTACARAFYVDGKPAALKKAFDGWKDDIGPARAALAAARGE